MGIEKEKGREAEPLMNRPSSSSIKRTHFRFDKQKNKWNHVILDLPLFLIRSIWPYLLTKKLITTTKISALRQFYITHQPRVKKTTQERRRSEWWGGKGEKIYSRWHVQLTHNQHIRIFRHDWGEGQKRKPLLSIVINLILRRTDYFTVYGIRLSIIYSGRRTFICLFGIISSVRHIYFRLV